MGAIQQARPKQGEHKGADCIAIDRLLTLCNSCSQQYISHAADLIVQLISNQTARHEDPRLLERVRRQAAHRVMALQQDPESQPLKTDDGVGSRHGASAVSVDRHRRVVVNGERFFPLGIFANAPIYSYYHPLNRSDFAMLVECGLNFVMPYNELDQAQMGWALEHNIRVAPSLKDFYCGLWNRGKGCNSTDEHAAVSSTIRKWASHPLTLFWYINDELDVAHYGPSLREHARWVSALDPSHPSWAVVDEIDEIAKYAGALQLSHPRRLLWS